MPQRKLTKALHEVRQLSHIVSGVPSSDILKIDSMLFTDSLYDVEHQLLLLSFADEQLDPPFEDFIT